MHTSYCALCLVINTFFFPTTSATSHFQILRETSRTSMGTALRTLPVNVWRACENNYTRGDFGALTICTRGTPVVPRDYAMLAPTAQVNRHLKQNSKGGNTTCNLYIQCGLSALLQFSLCRLRTWADHGFLSYSCAHYLGKTSTVIWSGKQFKLSVLMSILSPQNGSYGQHMSV